MDAVCQRRQSLVVFKATYSCVTSVYFRFGRPCLLFPVVGCCCNHLRTLSLNSWRSKTPTLPLEFWRYLSQFQIYKYFRFWRPYCYFRFSVVGAIICGHFLWTHHCGKLQNCRWNLDAIYRSSRYKSISGLGYHIAISGCRSLLQSFEGTFFELVMVKKPIVVVKISTLSIIVPEI